MAAPDLTRNCVVCQTPFVVRTNNRAHAKYCSPACQRKAQVGPSGRGRQEATCLNCGKVFTFLPSQAKGKYCSRPCKREHWQKNPSADRGFIDLTGQTFGRWTVLKYDGFRKTHHHWKVRCSCGAESIVMGQSLRDGRSQSCGCLARDATEAQTMPSEKACTKCGNVKPFTEKFFLKAAGTNTSFRWGLTPWCRECMLPVLRKRHLRFRRKLKREVLLHYSNGPRIICACCGLSGDPDTTEVHFFTLDHINNDGKEDRKIHGLGAVFYARMKKLGYPEHLQVLCWTCNLGKHSNGGVCPHQELRDKDNQRQSLS